VVDVAVAATFEEVICEMIFATILIWRFKSKDKLNTRQLFIQDFSNFLRNLTRIE